MSKFLTIDESDREINMLKIFYTHNYQIKLINSKINSISNRIGNQII